MNNQIDPITIILFTVVICSMFCSLSAYYIGKADGSKKAANDWNKLLEESEKFRKNSIEEYKEFVDELVHTIENKNKIIEEFKKLNIEQKEPVQRLWKVGDKFIIKGDPHKCIYTIEKIIHEDTVQINWVTGYITYPCTVVDAMWGKEWTPLQDTNPSDGC